MNSRSAFVAPTRAQRLVARERPARAAMMYQRWEQLLFLHWRCDAAQIAATLPAGLQVDTFDGAAWVGLVPLFMRKVRPRFVPPVPALANFLELNLRTYVHDAAGRPGLYFYSLDCDQPLAVEGARRLLGLRYEHARMHAEVDATGGVAFTSRRAGQDPRDEFRYRLDPDATSLAEPGTLEFFLIERYRLFAERGPRLTTIAVHHAPYRLTRAVVRQWSGEVLAFAGLARPAREPDHVCGAQPVDVEVFRPERVPR